MTGSGDSGSGDSGLGDSGSGDGAAAGGELMISGGGSTMVATDVVFAEVATLRLVQDEAEGWQGQIAQVRQLGIGPAPDWQPAHLGECVFSASNAIDAVAEGSRRLADRLVEAAEEYGRVETALDTGLRSTGSWLGFMLGALRPLAPLIALSLAPPLAFLAATSLISNAILGRDPSVVPPVFADWLRDNPGLLTDPVIVTLVRTLVSSADDAALGALGVPYPVAALLGDDGARVLGAPDSAFGLLVAAQAAGMLRETPVRVRQVGGSAGPVASAGPAGRTGSRSGPQAGKAPGVPPGGPTTVPGRSRSARARPAPVPVRAPAPRVAAAPRSAPTPAGKPGPGPASTPASDRVARLPAPRPPAGFADLADRIPTADDGGQVRIERYGDPAHPSWLVYLGGTLEWSPAGSTEPWDMTSNVNAVADQEAGSYRAVLAAMQAAGVQPGDPVVPVAHSQGGLIAAELAARGDINAVGLVTFGAPAGQVAIPDGLPAIAVEHSDDIIPALGGTAAEDDARLYVRREVFAGVEVPTAEALPAHQLASYRETARLVDASVEPRLLAFREQLGGIVGTTPGEQSIWRAERTD
ncbi:hypothetical protein [Cryobacterium sp. AP23]